MLKAGLLMVALLLVAPAAWAQVPALLPGRWEVLQLSFLADASVPDSVREGLDDPQVADLNIGIMNGYDRLLVEFRPDGTYEFSITRSGRLVRSEVGTYAVAHDQLLAQSPASTDGSSFHNQQLVKLTRRTLVLAFPVGPDRPGVTEEIEYRRHK